MTSPASDAASCPYCGEPKDRHEYASPTTCVLASSKSPAANRQELSDEERTVLEVYSRTHAGLVPDAIQAILAAHDAMLGVLEQIAQLDVIVWNADGSIKQQSEAGRLARSVVRDPRSSGNTDKEGSET